MKHQFIKHVFMRFIAPFASEEPDNKEQKGGGERSTWRSEFINILFTFASTAFVFFWTLQPYKWATNNIRKGWTRKVNLMSWVVWRASLNLSLFQTDFSKNTLKFIKRILGLIIYIWWISNSIFLGWPTKRKILNNLRLKDLLSHTHWTNYLYILCCLFII